MSEYIDIKRGGWKAKLEAILFAATVSLVWLALGIFCELYIAQ